MVLGNRIGGMQMSRRKKPHGLTNKHRDMIAGSLFFLPWVIGFCAITLYPLIYSIVISFNEVSIRPTGTVLTPRGWRYYIDALMVDTEFRTLLLESIRRILVGAPMVVIFALIVAMLLNRPFKGRTFFRVIFFLPVVIISGPMMDELMYGTSAMSLSFDFSNIAGVIQALPRVLLEPLMSFMNNMLTILWFSGVQTQIFIAVMQKIDRNMYEAASIDGATAWEIFWRITLPYLRPTILLNVIYTIVELGTFSSDGTNVKIVRHMVSDIARPFSFSAAMSWIYAISLLFMIFIAFLVLNDWKEVRRVRYEKHQYHRQRINSKG